MKSFNLNSDQERVCQNIVQAYLQYVQPGRNNVIIKLSGEPGTGKTYLMKVVLYKIAYLKMIENNETKLNMCFTTIAHRALENCYEELSDLSKETIFEMSNTFLEFKTVCSLLKKYPNEYGTFSGGNSVNLAPYDIICIDEYSCLGSRDFNMFLEALMLRPQTSTSKKALYIFLGDRAQLPPVMDKTNLLTNLLGKPEFFPSTTHNYFSFTLTQQMRQKPDLHHLSQRSRRELYIAHPKDFFQFRKRNIEFYTRRDHYLETAHSYLKYRTPFCFFNYTRKSTLKDGIEFRTSDIQFNASPVIPHGEYYEIRNVNNNPDVKKTDKLYVGDNLVALMPITDVETEDVTGEISRLIAKGVMLYTGLYFAPSGELTSKLFVLPQYSFVYENYLQHKMKLYQELRRHQYVHRIDEQTQQLIDKLKNELKFLKSPIILEFAYSKTVHSTQGLTIPNAFINLRDIIKCKSALQNILTVSYSRCKDGLHILLP